MSRYQRYPAYKNSGVEWIGEIPEHWEVKQARHVFRIFSGSTPKSGEELFWDGDITWFTPEDLGNNQQKNISASRRKITEDGYKSCGTSLAKANSLVLSTRAPIGHIALSTVSACCNQGCRILEPENSCSGYWYYTLLSAKPALQCLGQGSTFMELPRPSLASFKLPYPPLEEQQAIASFLDLKTAQIDDLIAKKEELLKKLDEKRTALITQAVTKGLDQSGPMKNSGVAWIGEIPRHWEVKRLKQTMLLITNKSCAETQNVALENIESWSGKYIPSDTEFEGDGVTFQVGDILFGKLRPYLAKAYLAEFPGAAVGDFHVMRPVKTILHGRYTLFLILNHGVISIVDGSTFGAKMPRVSWDFMGNLQVPVPPLKEQQAVAEHIANGIVKIARQKAQVIDAIERLKEYRITLIANFITGKYCVSHKS